MSERTGLGVVEIALLEALETSRFLLSAKALARVEERIGLAPGYAYPRHEKVDPHGPGRRTRPSSAA